NEKAIREIQEIVSGGSCNRPIGGQGLVSGEDFFNKDVFAAVLSSCGCCEPFLETVEISNRIQQAIDMVDAETSRARLEPKADDGFMGGVKDGGILHSDAHEIGNGEKATIVDGVADRLPESEAVVL